MMPTRKASLLAKVNAGGTIALGFLCLLHHLY